MSLTSSGTDGLYVFRLIFEKVLISSAKKRRGRRIRDNSLDCRELVVQLYGWLTDVENWARVWRNGFWWTNTHWKSKAECYKFWWNFGFFTATLPYRHERVWILYLVRFEISPWQSKSITSRITVPEPEALWRRGKKWKSYGASAHR